MKKVLAVALLDFRRLGFGLVAAGLIFGLVPSLASGLGVTIPVANILIGALVIVGLATGGSFGTDFTDGKGSFFFARPLPSGVLIVGRLVALITLAVAVVAAVMASNWISTSDRSLWRLAALDVRHAQALVTAWSLSLFLSLSAAAQGRQLKAKWAPRDFALLPFRMAFGVLASLLPFGVFADLMLRAYLTPTPAKILFGSFVLAAFSTCCMAIVAGRADRLRITRFLNLGVFSYLALAISVIAAAWTYILHPGPDAIEHVLNVEGSPDGRSAYVETTVNRGDPGRFHPIFVLDIASGQARSLNAEPNGGPWTSADGGSLAWSEATPYFFRPLWRYLGGATSFRLRTSTGEAAPLPVPNNLPSEFSESSGTGLTPGFETISRVLPASDGDVFAIEWVNQGGKHLTFTSRSRGQVSDIDLKAEGTRILATAFRPSGELRVAATRSLGSAQRIEFKDIDPSSGRSKVVGSVEEGNNPFVQFDAKASRALVGFQPLAGRTTLSLVDLNAAAETSRSTVLLSESINPTAVFLADGRVAAMAGGGNHGALRVFSATGAPVRDIPVAEGMAFLASIEMFPGVLAVRTVGNPSELLFIDSTTGALVRRLPSAFPVSPSQYPPPPGSPAARLLLRDDKLFELPSLTAEPRLLLPLPR